MRYLRLFVSSAFVSSVFVSSLWAQTLSLSSPAAAPGMPVSVEMTLDQVSEAQRPVALEWTVAYPAADLVVDGIGPVAAPGQTAAGKLLTCRGTWTKVKGRYSYHCILAGGNGAVAEGPVASLTFRIRRTAKPGPRPFEIENQTGVTKDSRPMRVNKANGTLSINALQ